MPDVVVLSPEAFRVGYRKEAMEEGMDNAWFQHTVYSLYVLLTDIKEAEDPHKSKIHECFLSERFNKPITSLKRTKLL